MDPWSEPSTGREPVSTAVHMTVQCQLMQCLSFDRLFAEVNSANLRTARTSARRAFRRPPTASRNPVAMASLTPTLCSPFMLPVARPVQSSSAKEIRGGGPSPMPFW